MKKPEKFVVVLFMYPERLPFIVLLGVLRDHAVNFAVVVNVDHAYLYIRHKGVQGGDEV